MTKGPHISIKPETIYSFGSFHLTNTYLASLIVLVLFFATALYYTSQVNKTKKSTFFYLIHFVVKSLYSFFHGVVEDKIELLFALVGSLFIYILLLNWFGLLPGVGSILIKVKDGSGGELVPILRGNTSDLNTTIMLALVAFFAIQYYGFKFLGVKEYLGKFLNFSNPIGFFTGILETISEFSKIISFSFRLFGNIFAGEVLLIVMAFLIPILASFPFLLLEIFVGLIQALVFSMLTAIFIKVAITKHHE